MNSISKVWDLCFDDLKDKDYSNYFAIVYYEDGELIRVDNRDKGNIPAGYYVLLPLFQQDAPQSRMVVIYDGELVLSDWTKKHFPLCLNMPNKSFLVLSRRDYPYTIKEVESINKIWNNLMSQIVWYGR